MAKKPTPKTPDQAAPSDPEKPPLPLPNPGGRPSKLTPALEEQILKRLQVCGTLAEVAAACGVGESTIHAWQRKGKEAIAEGKRSKYRKFLERVREAIKQRDYLREQTMVRHGTKDWRALWSLMQAQNPKRYAPRIRIHIEEELTDAIERLTEAFGDQPEILERALSALTGADSGGEAGDDPTGPDAEDDRPGGEAVQPTQPEPKTEGVS